MIAIFRLIRIWNLLIIVLVMMGIAYFILENNAFQKIDFSLFDYCLLILSTSILCAAGTTINDYFDIKADKINKPELLIVTKYLKKRWAILFHLIFIAIALVISIYLSNRYSTLFFVIVHIISISIMWYYSTYLKKKMLIGNLTIAILASCIPLFAAWYFKIANESSQVFSPYNSETWSSTIDFSYIYFLALCAFVQILAREVIKDIHDMEGDKAIHVYSLPMKFGVNRSSWFALILLQMPLVIGVVMVICSTIHLTNFSIGLLIGAGLINLFIFVYSGFIKAMDFKTTSILLNFSMILPLLSLFFNYK